MNRLYIFGNMLHLGVLLLLLLGMLIAQFFLGELPCSLCVLQRIALLLTALGPASFFCVAHRRPFTAQDIGRAAGITILASLLGAAISIRQILLHILPGDLGYAYPIWGYHLYTWALIIFACNLSVAGIQLISLQWFKMGVIISGRTMRLLMMGLVLMIFINTLAVIAETGFAWDVPSNPTGYLLFHHP